MEDTWEQRKRMMVQGAMGLSMMGRGQLKPRWTNYYVFRNNSENVREVRGGFCPPPSPPGGKQAEGGEGRSVL